MAEAFGIILVMSRNIHVTVAAIIERQGRFLLVEEEDHGRRVFNQPAGHLEEGESLVQAVVREVAEETGHEFRPQGLVGVYRLVSDKGLTFMRFCFHGQVEPGRPSQPQDADILACHWLTLDEIGSCRQSHRSALVLECLDDFLKGKDFPLDLLNENPGEFA